MNEVKIADAVLKAAEKAANVDLREIERRVRALNKESFAAPPRSSAAPGRD
ncbi:MAG: hypothetical protein IJS01_06760 [Lentisphaeria bacterium]|nr:hypothetical protein [Lentisphaeria bacterium]